jgi:hypothetical protein
MDLAAHTDASLPVGAGVLGMVVNDDAFIQD